MGYETTNARVTKVCEELTQLIDWAEADAQHHMESGAGHTAYDDRQRVKLLKQALSLLERCWRD